MQKSNWGGIMPKQIIKCPNCGNEKEFIVNINGFIAISVGTKIKAKQFVGDKIVDLTCGDCSTEIEYKFDKNDFIFNFQNKSSIDLTTTNKEVCK